MNLLIRLIGNLVGDFLSRFFGAHDLGLAVMFLDNLFRRLSNAGAAGRVLQLKMLHNLALLVQDNDILHFCRRRFRELGVISLQDIAGVHVELVAEDLLVNMSFQVRAFPSTSKGLAPTLASYPSLATVPVMFFASFSKLLIIALLF